MKTQKRFILLLVAAALVFVTVGCSFNFSTAKIEDAIMTTSIDADGMPGEEVVSFPSDASVIYTSAKVQNAPDHTQIRVVWTYVTGNQLIDEVSLDSGTISSRYIYSDLYPTSELPLGDYQVQYFIDDREDPDATVKFVVVAGAAKTTEVVSEAYLEEAHMTSYMDENGYPVDSIDTVGSAGTWYVTAILRNAQPDTVIYYVWYDTNGNVIESYSFDPQGETDIYIFGTLQITTIAPEGQYRVELYLADATEPSAAVDFNVAVIGQDTVASNSEYTLYSQTEGGFSILYPTSWNLQEVKENELAFFYPPEYTIEEDNYFNTVIVYANKGVVTGYTLDTLTEAWIAETEEEGNENYVYVDQTNSVINGIEMSIFEYSWTSDGYDVYTMDFLAIKGSDLYVITFTATQDVLDEMFPYVEQMVLSFNIL